MRSLVFVLLLALLGGCQTFDPPPSAKVDALDNGVMNAPPDAQFVIRFSEPVAKETLRVKWVKQILDSEGNLADEQSPPDLEAFQASTVAAFDGANPEGEDYTYGGTFTLAEDGMSLAIDPNQAFAVTQSYLVLIEPGLEDLDGHKTLVRQRIPFSYKLEGGCATTLPSGYYYLLMNVNYASTQVRTYAYWEVDQATGNWRGIFTKGHRQTALNSRDGCPSCSGDQPVCALIPDARCVQPSEKQISLEQFPDFLPTKTRPEGYYFITDGFACDQKDGTTAFGTPPFLIEITIGQALLVDAENSVVSGVFRQHEDGRWRATGGLSAERIKLNGNGKDPADGTWQSMSLTAEEVKAVESFGFQIPTDLER